MRLEVTVQHIAVESLQRLGRSKQRTPDRLVGIAEFVELLENDIVRRVLRRADFLLDDTLLAFEFLGVEDRVGQNVAQHIERERDVGLHHPRVISRRLDTGRGVEIAADGLDFLGDLP